MRVKKSVYGVQYREIYSSGAYCGLVHIDAVEPLHRLESAVRRSSVLRRELVKLMSGATGWMSTDLQWRLGFRPFSSHLYIDPSRGLLWSPAAWSLVMRVAKRLDKAA